MTHPSERVAIVGLAGRFPGAGADLDRFWTDVAVAADRSRDVPPGRWVLPHAAAPGANATRLAQPQPDTAYSARGYYLDPFTPELAGLAIDPGFVAELDPLFHLALDAGGRAWAAANTRPLAR